MTELSGNLEGIGLLPLVQFLTTVAKSGRLIVHDAELSGRLDIDDGLLVGAAFDQEQGMAALEAIALALSSARFDFRDATGPLDQNLRLSGDQVTEALQRLSREQAALKAAVPSLGAVPHLTLDEGNDDRQVSLDRDTLRLLIRLDGRHSVSELARDHGLLRTLRELTQLVQLSLVRVDAIPGVIQAPEPSVAVRPAHDQPVGQPTEAGIAQRLRPPVNEPAWSRWRRPTDHAG
ncbi:MAG: DUF4388 domain-containing protein [Chloroflexi bacterium]|nr:DUF4388 domain-containing protein [Chloroflexota bacterium]MBV9543433.1 DUF4388 domain-containing protein [Chloroflexota bacterium]